MLNLYFSIAGTLAIIWVGVIGYYLYITGDLLLVSMIVAFIIMTFRIISKTKTLNL